MTLNYAIWWFVQPSQALAFVFAAGFLLWIVGFRQPGRWLIGIGGSGLLLAGLTPIGHLLIGPLETRYPVPGDLGRVDGIVILGGSELAKLSRIYGTPQVNSSGGRYVTTLLLAAEHPRARVVHSGSLPEEPAGGGLGSNGSEVAASILLGSGIAIERLTLEDESRNTCENAAFSKRRVNPRADERWILVTSASHMPRAMACFRANDWAVLPYPTNFRRSPTLEFDTSLFSFARNLATLDRAAHEWLGLAYYRMRGLIE